MFQTLMKGVDLERNAKGKHVCHMYNTAVKHRLPLIKFMYPSYGLKSPTSEFLAFFRWIR